MKHGRSDDGRTTIPICPGNENSIRNTNWSFQPNGILRTHPPLVVNRSLTQLRNTLCIAHPSILTTETVGVFKQSQIMCFLSQNIFVSRRAVGYELCVYVKSCQKPTVAGLVQREGNIVARLGVRGFVIKIAIEPPIEDKSQVEIPILVPESSEIQIYIFAVWIFEAPR